VVQYLFGDPLPEALQTFFELGAALREAGRMPLSLPPVELGVYDLVGAVAAPRVLVGADVLPWRPMRGVYLLIEQTAGGGGGGDDPASTLTDLVQTDGVAGLWHHRGARHHERFAETSDLQLTVCYLDGDPVHTAARLGEALQPRWEQLDVVPLLAAPFEVVLPWAWDRAVPG
jgi:hypothetical protein